MSSSSYVGGVGGGEARDYGDHFVLPAAPAQRSLWFVCQLDPSSNAAYNVGSAVRLVGELDVVLLQRAVNAVVARHESLRTGVGLVDGDPRQVVLPEALVPLPVVDCSGLPEDGARARVTALAREQAAMPFALDAPPLLRLVLVKESRSRHTLLVTIHHLVCDSWSMDVFYADLAAAYRGLCAGGDAGLVEPPVQYADYVGWLERQLTGERMERLLGYWRTALAGTAPLELPVDRPRERRGGDGGRLEERLDAASVAGLEGLAKDSGGTLFMVLLTGFMAALSRVTGQEDVAVGTPVAGRHHPDAEQLVGFFANTLVLRARLAPHQGFAQAAEAVRDACVGAFSHDRMPFDRLVQEVRRAGALDRNPLFDVMFSMPGPPAPGAELAGLTMTPVELPVTAAKFDLWLTVLPDPDGDGLRLQLDYDRGLYDEPTASGVLGLYRRILLEALAAPGTPVGALPAGPSGGSGPAPAAAPADDRTVSQLLDARGADDVVLSSADAVLTLGELREWSGALARRLRAEGIAGPGVRVTTPPVPSAGLLAVVLAVLEVGATVGYGQRHDRAGAFVRRAEDEPGGWLITTGPRFDPAAPTGPGPGAPAVPGPDDPAWQPADGGPALTHRALVAGLTAVAERLGVTADDDVLLLDGGTPPSPVHLLMPLVHARSLMLSGLDPAPAGPPSAFVLADPPTWRRALTDGWAPPAGTRLVCVGEVLEPDLVGMLVRTGLPVVLGRPAPAPLAVPPALAPLDASRGGRLGPPLPGTAHLLLDALGGPVPDGVVGELHLATAGGPDVPVGLRCRRARDGGLEVVGPGAGWLSVGDRAVRATVVEQALRAVPGVRDAAVTTDADRRLIAWLVPDQAVPVGTERERDAFAAMVRARAVAALPGSAAQAVLGVLHALPTAPDGTPDRGALPPPPVQLPTGPVEKTPPRNGEERRTLAIFQEVLGRPSVGVHDDFFGLGGYSLLAAKLLSRVRAEFGVQVPVRDFFRRPTPAGLAAALAELERARDRRPTADQAVLAQLAGISDEEIDQILRHLN